MNDADWMQQFERGALSNDSFHHADHVRMAFLYLKTYPPLEALERFSSALARFAEASGKANLYNETVTWAFLLIIRERLARLDGAPTWSEFAAANQDLLVWENSVLKKYYRPETLRSEFAKKVFLFPDNM
ncbi:MAG TPA: hypothetical protein VE077_10390 [Candidatus Methylomirabilis sp.]|nr:hypothetical protein [Candidatus Methylomirabilis sp.]